MTPEQAKAKMKLQAAAKAKAASKPPAAEVEQTWKEAFGSMVKNSQASDWKEEWVDPLLDIPGTARGMRKVASGYLESIPGARTLSEAIKTPTSEDIQYRDESIQAAKDFSSNFSDIVMNPKKVISKGIPHMTSLASVFLPAGAKGIKVAKNSGPKARANNLVQKILDKNPNAAADLKRMGPDAIVGDVLGKEGRDVIKDATQKNSAAVDTMNDATLPRSLTGDTQLKTKLDDLSDSSQVERNTAYQDAYKAGGNIPYVQTNKGLHVPDPFKDLLDGGVAADAFKEAGPMVDDFKRHKNSFGGPLAEIDMTQRVLMAKARQAEIKEAQGRSDGTTAEQYRAAAQSLKDRADQVMSGPEYANARAIAEKHALDAEDIATQHAIDQKTMGTTKKAIHTGTTAEPPAIGVGEFVSTGALSLLGNSASAGMVGLGVSPGTAALTGLAATVAAGVPIARKMLKSREFKRLKAQAPYVARIMADKSIPAKAKPGLIDKFLESYTRKAATGLGAAGLTGDREGRN